MATKYRRARKYRKPPRRSATTIDRKAKSMQSSWRTATDRTGSLSIADAKKIIESPPTCIYCLKPVPWRDLSIDHMEPRSRGGSSEPDNLVYVDRLCNQIKGDLTKDEFIALLEFLKEWPRMAESVLNRLRMAAAMFKRRRRY